MIAVLVRCEHAAGRSAAARLRRRARAFLTALGIGDAELSLSLVGDRAIRSLNRAWRRKDAATDVLSFPLAEPPGGRMLGDVVISLDTARRVARAERRPVADELDRYLAHGILHLLGHDHGSAREAREMAAAEERLLAGEGLVGATLSPPPVPAERARRGATRSTTRGNRRAATPGRAAGRRRR